MSRYDTLNLLDVPVPDILAVPLYEALLSTRMVDLVARMTAAGITYDVGDLDSDPLKVNQGTSAFRETLVQARINDAVRAVLLASSTGTDLDNVVADFGLARKLLAPADPTASPPLAAVYESDESLKQRRLLAPEALSTAGPGGAYDFHVLDAGAGLIVDVISYGPEDVVFDGALPFSGAGIVASCYLPVLGNIVPPDIISRRVAAHLNSYSIVAGGVETVVFDKSLQAAQTLRPLSDYHKVRCADVVDYVIEVQVKIPPGPDPSVILGTIETRLGQLARAFDVLNGGVPRQILEGASVVFDTGGAPLVTSIAVVSPAADLPALPLGAYRCAGLAVYPMAEPTGGVPLGSAYLSVQP